MPGRRREEYAHKRPFELAMRLAILRSRAQLGIDAPAVTVEVFLSGGMPVFSVVGMAETAVRESKDRVRGAIKNSRFDFPEGRITVSLAPADLRKTGGRFDLPIALAILVASRQIPSTRLDEFEFLGELGLNGDLRSVPGVLPAALRASEAGRAIVVPKQNGAEASYASPDVRPAGSLLEVTEFLAGLRRIEPLIAARTTPRHGQLPDLGDVKGQHLAKRALEIAAAGGHHLLFIGPPGTGKSMLAGRLPGILPPMSEAEAIETAAIASILGRPFDPESWKLRPFRSPHHTASAIALVGGGSEPRPGEISRSHNGVLFLDEFPEFKRHVLEVLREPMETGRITISRAGRAADFPARFQLVAAMNPCPCGYLGDERKDCRCSGDRVAAYRGRISGPLLDRIDIQLPVQRPPKESLRPDAPPGESSKAVMDRVIEAREAQLERAGMSNALLNGTLLYECCQGTKSAWSLLERALDRFALSARVHQRVCRVSRTIADMDGSRLIRSAHMAEALALRQLDRGL